MKSENLKCPQCGATMKVYENANAIICPYCDYATKIEDDDRFDDDDSTIITAIRQDHKVRMEQLRLDREYEAAYYGSDETDPIDPISPIPPAPPIPSISPFGSPADKNRESALSTFFKSFAKIVLGIIKWVAIVIIALVALILFFDSKR